MGKSTHFFGQPVYGQLIKSIDRGKIIELSRKNDGEKQIKSFTGFTHSLTMLLRCHHALRLAARDRGGNDGRSAQTPSKYRYGAN